MAKEGINLKLGLQLLGYSDDDENTQPEVDLLALYYQEIAAGPMGDYRQITQYGKKQGQTYFMHALDGIGVIHRLRQAQIVDMSDLEERLLLTAYTIHDLNKIWVWRYGEQKLSYVRITTAENVAAELKRLCIENFFPEWENYIQDITLLAHYHQHDTAPLADLDQFTHNYTHSHARLQELGKLMQGIDNLDLSHSLSEANHKAVFLAQVNAISDRRWKWIIHRVGENRGLLTNIIHNETAADLAAKYNTGDFPRLTDMLYYSEGIAYLLHERVTFEWTSTDTARLAERVAAAVAKKQGADISRFIKNSPSGIKVDQAALEGGATFDNILEIIWRIVSRKQYKEEWYTDYSRKLLGDLEAALVAKPDFAHSLPNPTEALPPLEQRIFQCGELATAYRNLIEEHLKDQLKALKRDSWTHTYQMMELPEANFSLYNQVNSYRRGYFAARNYEGSPETLFDKMLQDIQKLSGERIAEVIDNSTFRLYLTNTLEFQDARQPRDFKVQLTRYIKDEHGQCCNCSSPIPAEEWMALNAPVSVGVQSFSNRLLGGSGREPKRNICGVCRAQFILEKVAGATHSDKHGGKYTSFYLHFYPYAFFTRSYLNAMYSTLTQLSKEDSRNFFLQANRYFAPPVRWQELSSQNLTQQFEREIKEREKVFTAFPTKVNGVSVPNFSEAVGNTPTIGLNAPGDNYGEQFLFALTHALMLADFFGCRVVMSRTPVPLFGGEYLDSRKTAFFVDGIPRNLRWLLPADEYSSLDNFREHPDRAHIEANWANPLVGEAQTVFEHITRRLQALYGLAQQIKPDEKFEPVVLDLATAAADHPLTLFFEADKLIEKKLRNAKDDSGKAKGAKISREGQFIYLSKQVIPLIDQLIKE